MTASETESPLGVHPFIWVMLQQSPLQPSLQSSLRSDAAVATDLSRVDVPVSLQPHLGEQLDLTGPQGGWNGSLADWLCRHFCLEPLHLSPATRVEQVHALAAVLFQHFQIEQGSLRLNGCHLEDRPLLLRLDVEGDDERRSFFDMCGEPLDESLAAGLGLDQLVPLERRTSRLAEDQLARWRTLTEAARQESRTSSTVGDGSTGSNGLNGLGRRTIWSVVWCKYAIGELGVVGQSERIRLPFEGWAAQLLSGRVKPAPFCEQATGDTSYELVRLDDGSLTASTAIAVCSVSGRRVLKSELKRCPATSAQALPEFFSLCPVTGDLVVSESLTQCSQCQQSVGSHCLESGVCLACRCVKPAGAEDPRLARVLGEHGGLNVWRRWRIAETTDVYVLMANALFRQMVLVLDKESLAARHLAMRSRFSRKWTTPSELEQHELLAGE